MAPIVRMTDTSSLMRLFLLPFAATLSLGATPVPTSADLVELFTAQGCPACPAADAALARLATRPGVIALSLPVTYWDQRGWRDPLAQPTFTERQRRYAMIGRRDAATPQFVINGRYATSDPSPAVLDRAVAAAAASGGPSLTAAHGHLAVSADVHTARAAMVWLADYDPRPIRTPVRAGANGGRTAVQVNVVRRFRALGRWSGGAARYRLPPLTASLRRAALVQSADGGTVIAAARIG